MKAMLSVPVPVKVIELPLAGTPLLTLEDVVTSFVTTNHDDELVNAGEIPVTVEEPPESVAIPLTQCAVEVTVLGQAAFAATVPHCTADRNAALPAAGGQATFFMVVEEFA